jgi:S1-C subfamily serine protease/transcriptional regulator with XRE-family HTH domain
MHDPGPSLDRPDRPASLGARLLVLRALRGLARFEVARTSGLDPVTLHSIESGARPATTDELHAIAAALGVSVAELVGDASTPPSSVGPDYVFDYDHQDDLDPAPGAVGDDDSGDSRTAGTSEPAAATARSWRARRKTRRAAKNAENKAKRSARKGVGLEFVAGLLIASAISTPIGYLWAVSPGLPDPLNIPPIRRVETVQTVDLQGTQQIAAVAESLLPSVVSLEVRRAEGDDASGSGVIYRHDGLILTNEHVVRAADQITVIFADGSKEAAAVIGVNPSTDIALIRVERRTPAVPRFSTDQPRIGELAVAIGSPFGLNATVTSGIVSATDRTMRYQGLVLRGLVQTDAAINPGNSGGVLANSRGEVIGINTAIISYSGTNEGLGFAIPIARAVDAAERILRDGTFSPGWLGILGANLDPSLAVEYDLPLLAGALVIDAQPDGPAADAGLVAGDVIRAVNGRPIAGMDDLAHLIVNTPAGEVVTLTVLRDGETIELSVTLGARPAN